MSATLHLPPCVLASFYSFFLASTRTSIGSCHALGGFIQYGNGRCRDPVWRDLGIAREDEAASSSRKSGLAGSPLAIVHRLNTVPELYSFLLAVVVGIWFSMIDMSA